MVAVMARIRFVESKKEAPAPDREPWTVLVADDEGDVHLVTKMVLENLRFEDRPVRIVSTYSGEETLRWMEEHDQIAVLLLDVVMESYTSGLDVVNTVRGTQANHEVRILLRSGQAGYANVSEIVEQYDINNYLRKENLRHQDLKDAVLMALRSYRDIQTVMTENRTGQVT